MACDIATLVDNAKCEFACFKGDLEPAAFLAALALAHGVTINSQTFATESNDLFWRLPPGMRLPVLIYLTALALGTTTDGPTLVADASCFLCEIDDGYLAAALISAVLTSAGLTTTTDELAADAKCLQPCLSSGMCLSAAIYLMAISAGLTPDAPTLAKQTGCFLCQFPTGMLMRILAYQICSATASIAAPLLSYVVATTTMNWTWTGTNPDHFGFYFSADSGVTWSFESSIGGASRSFSAPWTPGDHRVAAFDASSNRISGWSNVITTS